VSTASGRDLAGLLGPGASATEEFGEQTVDVPPDRWLEALAGARDALGLTFFDWLSAVDELDVGLRVVCHLAAPDATRRVLVRTLLTGAEPRLMSATGLFRGAEWHERETAEMFGVTFEGSTRAGPLLVSGVPGHPMRKDAPLVRRDAQAWPGRTDPSQSRREAPA